MIKGVHAAVGDSVGVYSRLGREFVERAENELQAVDLGGGDGAVRAANTVPSIAVAVLPARLEDLVVDVQSGCGAVGGPEAPDAGDFEAGL